MFISSANTCKKVLPKKQLSAIVRGEIKIVGFMKMGEKSGRSTGY